MDFRDLVNFDGELYDYYEGQLRKGTVCTSCGYEFKNYLETGRLGCSKCFDVFHDQIMREVERWKT